MKKYLPWIIVVTLMFTSGIIIYARGGFNEERKVETLLTEPTVSPTTETIVPSPTPTDLPTSIPSTVFTNTPTPIGTTPSIIRRGGEDD